MDNPLLYIENNIRSWRELSKKFKNNINIQLSQDSSPYVTAQAAASPGPPSFVVPVYAFVYSTAEQFPSKEAPLVTFDTVSVLAGGVTFDSTTSSLTVPSTGDYAVMWEAIVQTSPNDAAFGIFVNETLQNATLSGLALNPEQVGAAINGDAILSLNAGDVLTLRALIPPGSTQNNIHLTNIIQYPPFGGAADQPINSASLRIRKLSF
jgi:hypothetical protein